MLNRKKEVGDNLRATQAMELKPAAVPLGVDPKRKVISDNVVTGNGTEITLRQSIVPVSLVTILFFMWGFAYG